MTSVSVECDKLYRKCPLSTIFPIIFAYRYTTMMNTSTVIEYSHKNGNKFSVRHRMHDDIFNVLMTLTTHTSLFCLSYHVK